MGRRPIIPPTDLQNYVTPPTRRTIRKRKVSNGNIGSIASFGKPSKAVRLSSDPEDDEDSSSNDIQTPKCSSKHANNSSILLNSSIKLEQSSPATNESPRPVYTLRPSVVNGTILYDLTQKPWRLGSPIGKGNFGEIFLASDNINLPVTNENAKFVVKIEPHSNGPLFVEIHCLMNTAKKNKNSDEDIVKQEDGAKPVTPESIKSTPPSGIPDYIASGSHFFGGARYRFLVLQRFDHDLHSLIKNSCVSQKSILTLAIQIVNVLENLHDKGYCHNDVKSQNLMISKCKYYKSSKNSTLSTKTKTNTNKKIKNASKYLDNYEEKQPTTDSGNSSEQEANDCDEDDENFIVKRKVNKHSDDEYIEESDVDDDDDDEDFDDVTTTSNSMDAYKTPVVKERSGRRTNIRNVVQYSGSNPVRSCRRQQHRNSIYDEMVNSHYLRPSNKRISYAEFFDEDNASVKGENNYTNTNVNKANGDGDSRDTHMNSTEDDDDSNTCSRQQLPRHFESSAKKRSTKTTRNTNAEGDKIKNSPPKRLTRRQEKLLSQKKEKPTSMPPNNRFGAEVNENAKELMPFEAEHIFLIDFGLASKYIDHGVHRPFIMDQRRAHDGTLEFTSRDAHMGAHSRRSDLECLGYNLLYWSQGFLPWKDAAAQHQQEKVHRAKEYLMTDVREMLKLIYGKDVPKYLGDFLHLVGQLAYHDRPQYARYRRLFEHEYKQLGYSLANMCLDSHEISHSCVRIKKDHGAGKHDFFEQNNKLHNSHILSIMKSGGTPFQERNSIGDRVSPKNLRSKSDKKDMRKNKFCWAEVLSQDPDQIARERAEKEFDREMNDVEERPVRRYQGNPTYAILDLIKKNGEKYNINEDENENEEQNEEECHEEAEGEEEEEDEQDYIPEDEEENCDTEASEIEAEASDDNEEAEEEEDDEDVGGNESEDNQDESMRSSDAIESDDENDISQDEDEEESDDEDVESDISEASSNSEQYGTRGRNKQRGNRNVVVSNQKATKGKITKPTRREVSAANSRSSKSTTASSNASKLRQQQRRSTNNTTRKRGNATTTTTKTNIEKQQRQRSKRLGEKLKRTVGRGLNNSGHAFAASAAGEVEQKALKQFLYDQNQSQQQQQKLSGKTSKKIGKKSRRLIKTESGSELMNVSLGNGSINARILEDDSNSNLMLFNAWKTSNENIYARNAAAAAKSLATVHGGNGGGGGMVTRHYRK